MSPHSHPIEGQTHPILKVRKWKDIKGGVPPPPIHTYLMFFETLILQLMKTVITVSH